MFTLPFCRVTRLVNLSPTELLWEVHFEFWKHAKEMATFCATSYWRIFFTFSPYINSFKTLFVAGILNFQKLFWTFNLSFDVKNGIFGLAKVLATFWKIWQLFSKLLVILPLCKQHGLHVPIHLAINKLHFCWQWLFTSHVRSNTLQLNFLS